jgi:hypothetical protein
MKIDPVYFKNHLKHVSKMCWKNARVFKVKTGATWMRGGLPLVVFLSE